MAKSAKKKPSKGKLATAQPGVKKKAARTKKQPTASAGKRVPAPAIDAHASVLDRLWSVVTARRDAHPEVSHSARLLSRGTAKIAQKFGEEAVECLIEATLGNSTALVAESADVLYHLIVMWVDGGIRPEQVWAELQRREGVSGIAEKASRALRLPMAFDVRTKKIP
jgi:phosphoribosyl-ATP pyrophosphohydrolase